MAGTGLRQQIETLKLLFRRRPSPRGAGLECSTVTPSFSPGDWSRPITLLGVARSSLGGSLHDGEGNKRQVMAQFN